MDEKNIKKNLVRVGIALALLLGSWLFIRACSDGVDYFEPKYKIARDGTWYPISLYGKEKNMLGFTNELILKISEAEDFKVQLFNKGYTGLFLGLDNGDFDAIISTFPPTASNKSRYLFSDPIYMTGPVLIMRKGMQFKSLNQLEGRNIAFRRGDNIDLDFSAYPKFNLHVLDSYADAVIRLNSGMADAILMDAIPAYNATQGLYAGQLVVATKPLNNFGLRLVALKTPKSQALIDSFNEGLANMKQDGTFKKLLDAWQLVDTENPAQ